MVDSELAFRRCWQCQLPLVAKDNSFLAGIKTSVSVSRATFANCLSGSLATVFCLNPDRRLLSEMGPDDRTRRLPMSEAFYISVALGYHSLSWLL
jgi:hypothetical protein